MGIGKAAMRGYVWPASLLDDFQGQRDAIVFPQTSNPAGTLSTRTPQTELLGLAHRALLLLPQALSHTRIGAMLSTDSNLMASMLRIRHHPACSA